MYLLVVIVVNEKYKNVTGQPNREKRYEVASPHFTPLKELGDIRNLMVRR